MANELKTAFDVALRDFTTTGQPASGAHDPVKSEVRAAIAIANDKLNVLEAANTAGKRVGQPSYAALVALGAQPNGTIGEVPVDAGTHTDPIVGGTVSNAGVFVYKTGSPSGWQRVDSYRALDVASQPETDTGTNDAKAVSPLKLKTLLDARITASESRIERLMWAVGNQLPSALAPVIIHYVEPNRIVVVMKPQAAHYRDGYAARYDDVVVWEMRQLSGTYHPAGFPLWTMLSCWARFAGVWVPHANFSWSSLASNLFDTRVPASTNEPAWFFGKTADSAATINAANGSGPYHGNISIPFNPTFFVTGGIKNGVVIADGADVFSSFVPGEVIQCSQFDIGQSVQYKTPDGTVGMQASFGHLFRPLSGNQLSVSTLMPFGAAGYKATVAYSAMYAQRVANRAQARSTAGAVGPLKTIGLGAGASVDFGQAARVTHWNTDAVGNCMDVEISSTYAPYRVGGAAAAYTVPAFGLDNAEGMKLYFPIFQGSLDTDSITNLSFSQLVHYNAVRANGA